jgi:hypothetical protein
MNNSTRIPEKMKAYASFADWKSDQTLHNQQLVGALEAFLLRQAPQLTQTVKWGQGCWLQNGMPKMYCHGEDGDVQLGFYNGVSLDDPQHLLEGQGKFVRHVKIREVDDVTRLPLAGLVFQVLR